jgi:hypothetical protein
LHIRIAFAIAAVILVALLIFPSTRRMTANDFGATVGLGPGPVPRYERPADGDFGRELAWAVRAPIPPMTAREGASAGRTDGKLATIAVAKDEWEHEWAIQASRVRDLLKRFPDQPALYATLLAYDSRNPGGLYRRFECLLYNTPCIDSPVKPNPVAASQFIADAEAGCRLEPSNGYFAMMRACAYYNTGRDDDAIAELDRAARCAEWNEHYVAEGMGAIHNLPWVQRGDAWYEQASVDSAPHHYTISWRQVARSVTARAVKAEVSGNFAEGARIRRIVRRAGVVIRDKSHGLMQAFDGCYWVSIANGRPGGLKIHSAKDADRSWALAEATAQMMRKHGFSHDAAELENQARINRAAEALLHRFAVENSNEYEDRALPRSWMRLLACAALWAAGWWAVTCLVLRFRRDRASQPLSRPTAWGVAVGVAGVTSLLVGLCLARLPEEHQERAVFGPLGIVGVAAAFAVAALIVALLGRRRRSADHGQGASDVPALPSSRAATLNELAVALLTTVAILLSLFALAAHEAVCAFGGNSFLALGGASGTIDLDVSAMLMGCFLAVPMTLALAALVISLIKKRPVTWTALRAWHSALPWVACLLVAVYAVATPTMRLANESAHREALARIHNEPAAYAKESGTKWPVTLETAK